MENNEETITLPKGWFKGLLDAAENLNRDRMIGSNVPVYLAGGVDRLVGYVESIEHLVKGGNNGNKN